jgi:CubicO group peptidase (beta-lactamase class C family)
MDRAGNPLMATGFELTARQWARMGKLILNRGFYNGKQLVDPGLLDNCRHGSEANPAFGLAFWLNREAAHSGAREIDVEKTLDYPWQVQNWTDACICRDAPSDMIVSLGSAFQRLYIIPSLDLIIVRQGENATFSDADFLRILLADLQRRLQY